MDGTRMRLVALTAPLALGAVLGVAALLEPPADPPIRDDGEAAPASTRGPAVTASAVLGYPRTTPPPAPLEQAHTALAPAPLPEPVETADAR
ncbi:hypothetical protein H7X46_02030 [Pseudonocardia sp. C8]|uniref:hypothetical protein n=1 Tax=Pseudonocardia sp. C8 TaxID=2762759 RepID=UPI001642BEC7|nr:hypothetical protein [Pseudonocardia sp. C8]MBC3189842.1 hypothetical protein [Pseudonocardia sp. C8]